MQGINCQEHFCHAQAESSQNAISEPVVLPSYTHDHHASRARLAAAAGLVLEQYVQARSRGALYCCTIRYAWFAPDGSPLWLLNDLDGSHPFERVVVPVRNVRQCSGVDGRCVCGGETGGTASAGKLAPHADAVQMGSALLLLGE